MSEFILGLACFSIGVLLSSAVWIIILDRVTSNPQSEEHVLHEVIDNLKRKNEEG